TLGGEGLLRLWDVPKGKVAQEWNVPTFEVKDLNGRVQKVHRVGGIAFLPDGRTLMTLERPNILRHWESDSGKQLKEVKIEFSASAEPSMVPWLALSPDGRTLALVAWTNPRPAQVIVLVDTDTGEELRRLGPYWGGVGRPAFSPDGKALAASVDTK